jgi:hypothetical protein
MTFVSWSLAEDDQLRRIALFGASFAEIAAQMQRSKSSVRNRALKLQIAIARDRNPTQILSRPSQMRRSGPKAKGK